MEQSETIQLPGNEELNTMTVAELTKIRLIVKKYDIIVRQILKNKLYS